MGRKNHRMKLFLDTETTGVVDWRKGLNDSCQPRPVSVALVLTDEKGEVINSFYSLINCGKECPQEATNIHGITNGMIKFGGINPATCHDIFNDFSTKCNELIGHNIKFDETILKLAGFIPNLPTFCTMLESTNICRIPSPKIPGKYKWPKLEEAYRILVEKELTGAHNALSDVMATIDIWKALKKIASCRNEKGEIIA